MTKKDKAIISVIIPAYNAERYVAEAIESVLSQKTDWPFEVIVVDDGSTDRTAEAAARYEPAVHVVRQQNSGAGAARNAGGLAATGELLFFLDADDRSLPGRLQRQAQFMLEHPEIDATFGNMIVQHEEHIDYLHSMQLKDSRNHFRTLPRAFERLLCRGNFIPNSSTAVRRSTFIQVGMQRQDLRSGQDYDFWCKVARVGPLAYTTTPLVWLRRENHGNISTTEHAYVGRPTVQCDMIRRYGKTLEANVYHQALRTFARSANMLLRHEWAYHGREAVLARLEQFRDLLPGYLRQKWLVLSLVPGALPRAVRRGINNVVRPFFSPAVYRRE